jgi:hypothetical protein
MLVAFALLQWQLLLNTTATPETKPQMGSRFTMDYSAVLRLRKLSGTPLSRTLCPMMLGLSCTHLASHTR